MIAPADSGLIRLAQYLAGISAHQPIWREITNALVQLLGVEIAAVGERDVAGGVSLAQWTQPDGAACVLSDGHSAAIGDAVAEVLDSGFIATRGLALQDAAGERRWELLFLPMSRGTRTNAVLIIGEQRASPFAKPELDFRLAIAGLAAVTAERLIGERELQQHRAHLEELVAQRSGQLLETNHRLQQEVVQRQGAEAALRAEKDNLLRILEAMDDFVLIIGEDYRVHYMNPALKQSLGDGEALLCHNLLSGLDRPCEDCQLASAMAGEARRFEWDCAKNGRIYDRTMTVLEEPDGSRAVLAILRDITERKRSEDAMRQMAYHDPLTGLPNRVLFHDRLSVELARAKRWGTRLALLVLDLDRFKAVNDTLGHHAGDQLLQSAGARMTARIRAQDTVARTGGDEFMLILPDLKAPADAAKIAAKLVNGFSAAFELQGSLLTVTASVGVALYPDDAVQDDALIEQADRAMYHAKRLGRSGYQLAGETLPVG